MPSGTPLEAVLNYFWTLLNSLWRFIDLFLVYLSMCLWNINFFKFLRRSSNFQSPSEVFNIFQIANFQDLKPFAER